MENPHIESIAKAMYYSQTVMQAEIESLKKAGAGG